MHRCRFKPCLKFPSPFSPEMKLRKLILKMRANLFRKISQKPRQETKKHWILIFRTQKTNLSPLEQFKSAANIVIMPEIYSNLSQTDYSIFTCSQKTENAEGFGFITRFKSGATTAYYADLYKKMNENLASWEGIMFSNLSSLLFPDKKISQKPAFKSTKYITENGVVSIDVRYANVKSEDGADLSIDYAVFEENIYIFNNPQCLRKALDRYEPVLEP